MKPICSLFVLFGLGACGNSPKENPKGSQHLPFLGEPMLVQNQDKIDTLWPSLPGFKLLAHTGDTITDANLEAKVRIADFFFTSCPTICPMMSSQMLRIHEQFKDNKDLVLLSHSIDPEHDTKDVLAQYAKKLGATAPGWYFLTGDLDQIFSLADAYGSFAEADPNAPGGYAHSGALTLADRQGRIRGIYDGTNPDEVDKLMVDLGLLLSEPLDFGPPGFAVSSISSDE